MGNPVRDTSHISLVQVVDDTGAPVSAGGGGGGGAITSVDLGVKADTSATTDTGTFSLISLTKRALEKFTVMVASLGGVADVAWASGSGSIVALLKTIAGKSLDTSPIITVVEAPSYTYIAASATDTAAGDANDLIDSILVIPATLNPGAVSIEDGAGTNRVLFTGGTASVSTLIPFPIDLRNIVAGTAWEITTGADVAVMVFYRTRT